MRSLPRLSCLPRLPLALGLLAATGAPALAQSTALVVEGDVVAGIGTVLKVRGLAVNDQGDWVAQVLSDTGLAVIQNGVVILQAGDPLGAPAGTYGGVSEFGSMSLNNALERGSTIAGGASAGAYFGASPLTLKGAITGAPSYAPGTPYSAFYDAELNDARQVLVSLAVEDPAVVGILDRALMVLQADPAGVLLSETAVLREGQTVPGLASALYRFPQSQHGFAINEAGDVLTQVTLQDNMRAVLLNQTVLALQGDQSPEFGKVWGPLDDRVDLGDNGDYAFIGNIGFDAAVIWNGVKVIRRGEGLPDFAPYVIESLGSQEPVHVDANGAVVWYGDWDDADTTRDTGVFRDHKMILQEGVSLAAGQVIDQFTPTMELSDNGRYFAYVAELADGREGAFLLELESELTPYQGCAPNPGVMVITGQATPGTAIVATLDNGQAPGVTGFLAIAAAPAPGFPPCGTTVPGLGELLIDTPIAVVPLSAWTGTFFSVGLVPIPNQHALIGAEVYLQGAFLDLAGVAPAEPVRLTDAWTVRIGAN